MFKGLSSAIKNERGTMAIEFAFVGPIFFLLILLVYEANRYVFISTAIDLTASEAARMASRTDGIHIDYEIAFKKYITEQSYAWSMFIDADKITAKVSYCNSLNDIIQKKCSSLSSRNKKLAVYEVNYAYDSVLFSMNNRAVKNLITTLNSGLNRTFIFTQEAQVAY